MALLLALYIYIHVCMHTSLTRLDSYFYNEVLVWISQCCMGQDCPSVLLYMMQSNNNNNNNNNIIIIIIIIIIVYTYVIYVQPLGIDHAVDKSCDIRSLWIHLIWLDWLPCDDCLYIHTHWHHIVCVSGSLMLLCHTVWFLVFLAPMRQDYTGRQHCGTHNKEGATVRAVPMMELMDCALTPATRATLCKNVG